nr:hypothetical protein [uncultured Aminipila sp.]
MFLGLGYGPIGDGYREKAVYKFNFEGDVKEIIEKGVHTYANVNKEPQNSNTYYYFQENEDQSKVQLMRVNYNEFSDQKSAEFDYEDVLLSTPSISVNQQDLYYFNINDNCLYRRSFSDSVKVKLLDNVGEIENILFYNDTAYILLPNKCVKVNLKSNLPKTIFEEKMIGWGEN